MRFSRAFAWERALHVARELCQAQVELASASALLLQWRAGHSHPAQALDLVPAAPLLAVGWAHQRRAPDGMSALAGWLAFGTGAALARQHPWVQATALDAGHGQLALVQQRPGGRYVC